MKRFVTTVLCAALVFSFVLIFASCGQKNYAAKNTEFYIGASGPLTGGASVYGIAVENAAKMAVEEINAAGGVNGVKLKFVMTDDKHDASNVSANYTKMFEEGMQVALGCVTTQPCLEFKALSHEDNLFFLTPSASADAVVEYDNAYQMCFADNKQGAKAAEYVLANCMGKSVGVLYRADDAYSTGILSEFEKGLGGMSIVKTSFTGNTVASFASQIEQLKNCDFIFLPIYSAPAAQFMTEAKNTVKRDAIYYGCDGLDGIDTSVEGFDINTIPQEVSFLSHFNSKATKGAAKDFIDKYTKKYGTATLNQFAASAYDCVYAIAKALEKANVSVTASPSEVCDALKGIFQGSFTFSGVTGTDITWDASGFVKKGATKFTVKGKDN
ncbi:MAG: ABC transporter substrate-binding protein [Eubacteriales bacterium]|nr:ABC transporter substrate-binding protein [Eubacteriales bacterium]